MDKPIIPRNNNPSLTRRGIKIGNVTKKYLNPY
jgi:hypothetical protein